METSLPPEFFQPLQTALGMAWPRPRLRLILSGIENVQKRMAELRMRMDGVRQIQIPKEQKMQRWELLRTEGIALDQELNVLMSALQKNPATKEQFKRPNVVLSQCCDAYTNSSTDMNEEREVKMKWKCVECGRQCMTYIRSEREDWQKEYTACIKEEDDKRKAELLALKGKSQSRTETTPQKLPGSYLI